MNWSLHEHAVALVLLPIDSGAGETGLLHASPTFLNFLETLPSLGETLSWWGKANTLA